MLHSENIKYGEYKARIEVKDSIGTPQQLSTTWRGDIIKKILKNAQALRFEKGNTIIIEIVPIHKDFTKGLFTEV
jgi:hypothetical protein